MRRVGARGLVLILARDCAGLASGRRRGDARTVLDLQLPVTMTIHPGARKEPAEGSGKR
ncbi:MAG TPA: hypothetical protein VE597_03955 [Geminicoccaceae bacterium]|nr:hypothetical protein [Geminicoccaceae bacterium]